MRPRLPLLVAFVCAATLAPQAQTKQTLLMNRLGPSQMVLYIAVADGSGERPLLASSGFDYNASFSSDGRWIVFTSERAGSGQADVYRVRPDGSGLERLTDDAALDDQGALSPDGRSLAFVSTRGAGVPNVWVLDLKTRQARNLTGGRTLPTTEANLKGAFRPSWSPDGRWIAFTSDRHYPFRPHKEPGPGWEHPQELNVYVIQPDGQGLRRLTTAGATTGSPKWSPDGRRIVFYEVPTEWTFAARIQAQGRVTSQIVSVDVASGARTMHTSGPGLKVSPQYLGADRIGYLVKAAPQPAQTGLAYTSGGAAVGGSFRSPSWSPDGTRVVYQKADYTARPQNQLLYSWEPGMDVRYTEVFPHFSKDGRLAVSEIRNLANTARAEIAVMNPDGSNRKVVYAGGPGAAFFPTWSPDGQWIAVGVGGFFGARDSQPAKLMLVRTDGSQQTRELTSGLPNAGFPSFSPDGARIAYRVWGEQGGKPQYGIRVMTLADGSVRTLTTEMDNFPSWSPAGDLIAFTRRIGGAEDYDYDIFTMRPDGTNVRRLTTTPGNDGHSFWSPDGTSILWSSGRNGFKDESALYDNSFQPFAQIYIMNADGSNQRPLTDSRWEDSMPGLVPQSARH
ncbi:MAG: PD40 domain-containing protein [Acidobacteria bacterium]|nr:PD40 domain-containing protein [Acidobacteriota bacterium]